MKTNTLSRYIAASMLLLALFGITVVGARVNAEETEKPQTIRARQLENREALKENLIGKTMNKGWSKVPRMLVKERFDHVIKNLENVATRVQKRIDAVEETGEDMTDAQASLDDANEFIADAKATLEDVKEKIEDLKEEEEQPTLTEREEIKSMFKEAKELLVSAHKSLRDAVKEIKAATEIETETSSVDEN